MTHKLPSFTALVAFASLLVAGENDAKKENTAAISSDNLSSKAPNDPVRHGQQSRLNLMRSRAFSLTAEIEMPGGPATLQLVESPLLRYSNPESEIVVVDATVWAWGRIGRPSILASVEESGCEVVSFADERVSLRGKSGLKWSSPQAGIEWKSVPDAPDPDDTYVGRGRQMKQISRRFAASGHYGESARNYELRLLQRPLHRYAAPDQQLVDGGIFAFVAGTNPEVLLLLECRPSGAKQPSWHCGFTRLSAGGLDARLGPTTVWTCQAIRSWSTTAPYSSIPFGEEDFNSVDKRKQAPLKNSSEN